MRIPKRYGQSRVDDCPFCGKQATTANSQGVTVCPAHKQSIMNDMKCLCGEYADIMTGKYGFYFRCIKCGNVSKSRIFEINKVEDMNKNHTPIKKNNFSKKWQNNKTPTSSGTEKKEIIIRSDDPDYFD